MGKLTINETTLTAVANKFRAKTGTSEEITTADYVDLLDLWPELQDQLNRSVTSNGVLDIYPETGFDAVKKVHLTVNVPAGGGELNLQDKFVMGYDIITSNGGYTFYPDEEYDGMSSLTVPVNVQPNLEDKNIIANGTYTASEGYDGFGSVTVNVAAGGVAPQTCALTIEVQDQMFSGLNTNTCVYYTTVTNGAVSTSSAVISTNPGNTDSQQITAVRGSVITVVIEKSVYYGSATMINGSIISDSFESQDGGTFTYVVAEVGDSATDKLTLFIMGG